MSMESLLTPLIDLQWCHKKMKIKKKISKNFNNELWSLDAFYGNRKDSTYMGKTLE